VEQTPGVFLELSGSNFARLWEEIGLSSSMINKLVSDFKYFAPYSNQGHSNVTAVEN